MMTENNAIGISWFSPTCHVAVCFASSFVMSREVSAAKTGMTNRAQEITSAERSPRVKIVRNRLRKRRQILDQSGKDCPCVKLSNQKTSCRHNSPLTVNRRSVIYESTPNEARRHAFG